MLPSLFSDCFWVTCTVLWSFTWRKLSTGNRILTVLVQACLTLCDPMDCSPPGSTVRGNFPGKNARVGCHALLQGIFRTQESKHRSPAVQVDSLLSEPLGKPKNTGVGCHLFTTEPPGKPFLIRLLISKVCPGGTSGEESACQRKRQKRCGFNPYVRKTPWSRAWQPNPVFLPGKSHGERSLTGYSP